MHWAAHLTPDLGTEGGDPRPQGETADWTEHLVTQLHFSWSLPPCEYPFLEGAGVTLIND